jgi:hypothetical protein
MRWIPLHVQDAATVNLEKRSSNRVRQLPPQQHAPQASPEGQAFRVDTGDAAVALGEA